MGSFIELIVKPEEEVNDEGIKKFTDSQMGVFIKLLREMFIVMEVKMNDLQ